MQSGGHMSIIEGYAERAAMSVNVNSICAVTVLDGVSIPFIMRGLQAVVPVRLIERHFLSKYMNAGNLNVTNPIPSFYLTETEANLLSSAGQGVFTTQDLVVSLAGFIGLYEKLKKMFPVVPKPTGGWVQINNTVIPFVVKDDSKMIALSIVRCAAGLLMGHEVPSVYPNQAECDFLNAACKEAGIQFEFTSRTELVELVLLECMCEENPVIRELPEGNPFAVAEFMDHGQLLRHNQSQATTDKEPVTNTLAVNFQPNTANDGTPYDQSNQTFYASFPQTRNIPLIDASCVKVIQPVPDYNIDPNTYLHTGLVQTPYTRPIDKEACAAFRNHGTLAQVVTNNNTLQALIRAEANKGPQENVNTTKISSTPRNAAYVKPNILSKNANPTVKDLLSTPSSADEAMMLQDLLSKAAKPAVKNTKTKKQTAANYPQSVIQRAVLMESATDEEKQLMTSRMQELSKFGNAISVAGDNLTLCRVRCFGKTISCMVKNEELYILLEAMNRLYFPVHKLDVVCKIIINLGITVYQLTDEEEREFVKFYKLPAHKLNSNQTIKVSDFVSIYNPLSCILNSSEFAFHANQVTSIPVSRAADVNATTNQTIQVSDFVNIYNPLSSILNSSEFASRANQVTSIPFSRAADVNAANGAASVNPVPIGNPVLNTVNFRNAQNCAERYNPNLAQLLSEANTGSDNHNYNIDRTAKRTAGTSPNSIQQLCIDTYAQYSDTSSISPKPVKRSRTRVIGEVICIDD